MSIISYFFDGDKYARYDDDDDDEDSQEYSNRDSVDDDDESLSIDSSNQEGYDNFKINYVSPTNCLFDPKKTTKKKKKDEQRLHSVSMKSVTFDVTDNDDDEQPSLDDTDDDDDESSTTQTPPPPLEDTRKDHIVDLAICAKRMQHMIHGIEFNKKQEINFQKDLKFFVVMIRKPMGIIFQENDCGCWIAKVLANSNATATASTTKRQHMLGKNVIVETGDQLLSIDGKLAYKITVDKLSHIVKKFQDKDYIEMTFVRYVGPIIGKRQDDTSRNSIIKGPFTQSDDKLNFLYGLKSSQPPENKKKSLLNNLVSPTKIKKKKQNNNNKVLEEVVIKEGRDDVDDNITKHRERSSSRVGNMKKLMCITKLH